MKVAAIILAAGGSTRMRHGFKLTMELLGKPLLLWTVEAALRSSASEVVVVTGNKAEDVEALLPREVKVVRNERWFDGISTSIRRGVASVSEWADGAVIMLADQPLVRPATIDELVAVLKRGKCVAYCLVGGEVRNPVAFARSLFTELLELKGDRGAKEVATRNAWCGEAIVVDRMELIDIDTEEDLKIAAEVARNRGLLFR